MSPMCGRGEQMQTPEIIKKFYRSKQWKRVRLQVIQIHRGRCQECGKAGTEVHHKTPLTEANVCDPHIALGLDNLELLCTSCHDAKRSDNSQVRFDLKFDENGDLIQK